MIHKEQVDANPLLAIVIPTCNRAEYLDKCLEVHIPMLKPHGIPLYIVDNASTDATAEVVRKRMRDYSLIKYHRNDQNIGAEGNVILSLKSPKTRYVWILADNYQIPANGLDYVLEKISNSHKEYTAVVLNIANQKQDLSPKDYTDQNELLASLGAVMTCLSCLVINKDVIDRADFSRYKESRFIQTGIIFEDIAGQPFVVHFAQSMYISNLVNSPVNEKAWSKTALVFDIACHRWVNFVYSLPFSYNLENKTRCIADLTTVSTIFTLRHLLFLRRTGVFNYSIYRTYQYLFPLTIKLPKTLILFIALTPISILRFISAMKAGISSLRMLCCRNRTTQLAQNKGPL